MYSLVERKVRVFIKFEIDKLLDQVKSSEIYETDRLLYEYERDEKINKIKENIVRY